MHLPGHSHFGTVTLHYATGAGFPRLRPRTPRSRGYLLALTERPFHDKTNEDVADALFEAFDGVSPRRHRPVGRGVYLDPAGARRPRGAPTNSKSTTFGLG